MRRVGNHGTEPLYGLEATRSIERIASSALLPHTLMARAGLRVAELTRALTPHARRIWMACGPGDNGGDGLVAAAHLHRFSQTMGGLPDIVVSLCGDPARLPPDAAQALQQALAAGVQIQDAPPSNFDFAVDALLGMGCRRPPEGLLAEHLRVLRSSGAPVLSVDLPSGLDTDTGVLLRAPGEHAQAPHDRHTLALLTLKPGLFTADGRDEAGQVWFDNLGAPPCDGVLAQAQLFCESPHAGTSLRRAHASHKGSYGEVVVLGGQDIAHAGAGMTGAAVLAARAALHSGAGRVYVALLGEAPDRPAVRWDPACPELMFRSVQALMSSALLQNACVVCGCGGGDVVVELLPAVLAQAPTLVLDADALNAIAQDSRLQTRLQERSASGWITVLTPHPLEAARLLGSDTATVMSDRLAAAQRLSNRFAAICVLKGSGTVISTPGRIPMINASGNAALATAGTGDVLAGMIGSALALPAGSFEQTVQRVAGAVHRHGHLADRWIQVAGAGHLTASLLAAPPR